MSAIVEGVSMARHCGECELNKLNWDRCHQILRGCPIIGEMPDKHGRLIDADELIKSLREGFCGERCIRNHNCFNCGIDGYIRIMENEPTVIGASE